MRAGAGLTVRTSSSSRQYPGGAARDLVFTGLMTCALTALLISPISWDHHWVWLAPGLALLIDAGRRASRAWYALAAATWAVFAAWPDFWSAKAGLLQGGLTGYAPATAWAYGDNPAYAEYHWHGPQLLAGNLEPLAGLALFVVALAAAAIQARPAKADRLLEICGTSGAFSAGLPHAAGIGTASRSGPGDCP